MNTGIYTWDALPPIAGNLLVVLNSAAGDTAAAAALLAALAPRVPVTTLHVIAERSWAGWLSEQELPAGQVLICEDYEGREIEVNHFLQSPAAVLWCVEKQFVAMIGSDAQDLHNERVNRIFEQRALLLMGDGRLLLHTLPTPYVYVFDVSQLLARSERAAKVRDYDGTAQALIADLHRAWEAAGRPAHGDQPEFDDVLPIVARHLGAPVLAYDEVSPIPLAAKPHPGELSGLVTYFQSVVREHDRQLDVWARAYAERKEAADVREAGIKLRDNIIDDLRLQLEPWHRKLRRRLKGKP